MHGFKQKLRATLRRLRPCFIRAWAMFCDCPNPDIYRFYEPNSATVFLRLYLLAVFLFAFTYTLPESSFLVAGSSRKLTGLESIYFSVVSITTLGFGDIVPNTSLMRIVVAIEALLGILLIGIFLVWLGHTLSQTLQEQQDRAERARLDRPLFPKYIEFVNILSNFLRGYDTDYGRPMNSYGWNVYEFGPDRVSVATTFFDIYKYIQMHGGPSGLTIETTAPWEISITNLEIEIDKFLRGQDPTIDDIQLIKRLQYLKRHAETIRQDLGTIVANRNKLEDFVKYRCITIESLINECEKVRSYITNKADNSMDGVDARYEHFYRRTRTGPITSIEQPPGESKPFNFGRKIARHFIIIRRACSLV